MSPKISKELARHRLEQAKDDCKASLILYDAKKYANGVPTARDSIVAKIETLKLFINVEK